MLHLYLETLRVCVITYLKQTTENSGPKRDSAHSNIKQKVEYKN